MVDWLNLEAYPKSQSLILPLFNDKVYISDHDVLDFDICVDEAFLMHVVDSVKQLSKNFEDFLFLEDFEFDFEIKQRLLGILHNQINIWSIAIEMIQGYKIVVIKQVLNFNLVF